MHSLHNFNERYGGGERHSKSSRKVTTYQHFDWAHDFVRDRTKKLHFIPRRITLCDNAYVSESGNETTPTVPCAPGLLHQTRTINRTASRKGSFDQLLTLTIGNKCQIPGGGGLRLIGALLI